MASSDPTGGYAHADEPLDDLADFFGTLHELKSTGCNLLVVGDAPRPLFARASGRMLGDAESVRYRVLAMTDATPQSIADRLPDPAESPRSLAETAHVLTHAGARRSVTESTGANTPSKLAGVRETRIADPELTGLQSALVEVIDEFADDADAIRPADVRVSIDSLEPLLDFYGEDAVRRCLGTVGGRVRDHEAMAHYVLPKPFESDAVRDLAGHVDAIVELRLVDSAADGQHAEQRWHVPSRDLTVGWTPL